VTENSSSQPDGIQARIGPGSRIAGYLIEEQVGSGGMAVVYRARDEVLGRLTALKVLSPALAADQEFRNRFLRESRAIASVDEPHIVPVYAAGEADGVLYIATRFVAGGDLASLLRRNGGPLPTERVAVLIGQIAAALDAAHAIGLVHRDVKPGNVLVENIPGRPEQAYLSDFGLTKVTTGATSISVTGMFMGTPDYCAPEQITGKPVDGSTDQYALACVAYNLLTGTVPYQREETIATLFAHVRDPVPSARARRAELSPAVDAVLEKAMAKEQRDRYGSCEEFAAALGEALRSPGAAAAYQPGGFQPAGYQPGWAAAQPGQPSQPPYQPYPAYQPTASYQPQSQTPPGTPSPGPSGYPLGAPQAWGQAAGSPSTPPGTPVGPTFPGGPGSPKRSRRTGVIAGAAGLAALVAVGIGVTLAFSGHNTSTRPPTPPTSSSQSSDKSVLRATFTAPDGGYIYYAFFSLDGSMAAGGGVAKGANSSKIYVWDVATRKYVTTLVIPGGGTAFPLCFSPDDKSLIAVDVKNYIVYRFTIATGQATNIRVVPSAAWNVSGDASTLANETANAKDIDVFNINTGTHTEHFPNPTTAPTVPNTIYLDSNGQEMIISAANDETYVVSVQSGQTLASFHYHYSANEQSVPYLSPDGKTVYIPGDSSTPPKLFDVATQSEVTPADSRWPGSDNGLVFSTDGLTVVTSPPNADYFDVWNVSTRTHIARTVVPGGENDVLEALAPGNSELLLGSTYNSSVKGVKELFLYQIP
jgi:serine/threonine-protein kinase